MKTYKCIFVVLLVSIFIPSETFAQRWTSKASYPISIKYHTISSIDNKLYSIGGFTNTWVNYSYEYDPALNSWTPISRPPSGYYFLKSAVVNDKIYVFGYNGIELAVFEYDPALDSWITKTGKTGWRYTFSVASYNNKIYVIGGRDSSGVTDSVEEYDPVLDSWQTKTPMTTARQSAAAVEYNGKIYVAGGNNGGTLFSTFEVYDPTLDSWTSKPSMQIPRKELELQVLEGNIYAMGGSDSTPLTTVEEYNINSETWAVTDTMSTSRESFASGVVNNIIYAVGGQSTPSLTDVNEAFNASSPETPAGITAASGDLNVLLTWNSNTEIDLSKYVIYRSLNDGFSPVPADSIGLTLIPDTTFSDSSVANGINYYYRLSAVDSTGNISEFSSQVTAFPNDTTKPAAPVNLAGSPGNTVVDLSWSANSESDLRQYNIYRNLSSGFTPTSSDSVGFVLKPDSTFSDSSLTNNVTYYYQIAALDSSLNLSSFSNEVSVTPVDLTAPTSLRWISKASHPLNLKYHTISSVNNKLYSIGGFTNTWIRYTYEYDPALNSWTPKTQVPSGYYFLKSAVVNDKIYVIGYNGVELAVFEYDPALNSWITKNGKTSWRYTFSVASYNSKIYVIGGRDSSGVTDSVEEYDPLLDTWQTKTAMPTARQSAAAVEYNGKIYVAGGNVSSQLLSTFEVYDPVLDSWTSKPSMLVPRKELELQEVDGIIYAMGGTDNSPLTLVESYDVNSETWEVNDSMLTPRESFASGVANDVIYAVGGQSTSSLTNVNEAFGALQPSTPTGITTSFGDRNVFLVWNSNIESDLSKYVIYKSLNFGFSPLPSDSIGFNLFPDTTFNDTSVVSGITYYYRLSAVDTSGNISPFSSQVSATPQLNAPSAPVNLEGSPAKNASHLSWSANSEPDLRQYKIYRSLTPGFTPTALDSVGFVFKPDTTFSDLSLTNGITYYYQIAALDSTAHHSDFSNEVSVTPADLVSPAAPSNLTATGVNESIDLVWDLSSETDIEKYILYRSQTDGFSPQPSDSLGFVTASDSTFSDSAVTVGQIYYYRVSAIDSALNESAFSNQASAIPIDTVAPAIPVNLTAVEGTDRYIDLSWDANTEPDLTDYIIYRSQLNDFSPSSSDSIAFVTSPAVTYRDSALVIGTTYYYKIAAIDTAFNYSGFSTQDYGAAIDTTAPNTPQNLTAADGSDNVLLEWDQNVESDLLKYTIYRSTTPGFSPVPGDSIDIAASTDTTFTDTLAAVNTTYYYRISASDSLNQESSFSNEASATPFDPVPPAAPTNLIASAGNSQVSLVWDLNSETDMNTYIVYRSQTPGFTPVSSNAIGVNTHPDITYTDNDVYNNATYYYKIAATDSLNNISTFSNEASATPVPLLNYSWQTKAVMTTARFASASATYDGKIYTAGGRTGTASNEISDLLEEYDPNTNTWAPKDTMLTIRENFAGDILSDKLIIIGGEASGTKLKTVEAYKPTTDSWDTQTSISSKRRSLSVTSLGGKLYAIGGRRRNKAYRDDNEEYDPVTDVWVNRTIMPTTRYAHASTAYNGKIYVIGGDNGSYLGTLEAYDQATDTWTTLTPMPTPRRNLTFNTLAGRLYAIGGEDGSGHLPTVEIYDPGTDTWVAGDSMLTARYDHSAAVVDDIKLYA
ncbi:MAG: hypothetical protein GY863_01375, partial [bacterium]|nr:hypothetical protein [bacterium]